MMKARTTLEGNKAPKKKKKTNNPHLQTCHYELYEFQTALEIGSGPLRLEFQIGFICRLISLSYQMRCQPFTSKAAETPQNSVYFTKMLEYCICPVIGLLFTIARGCLEKKQKQIWTESHLSAQYSFSLISPLCTQG